MRNKILSFRRSRFRIAGRSVALAFFAAISIGLLMPPSTASATADKAAAIREIKGKYICPDSGLSIIEAESENKPCPQGSKIIELVGLMADAKWDNAKILSYLPLFITGVSSRGDVDINGQLFIGRPDAPVVMVEFIDFQCPFCGRFDQGTFPELKSKYVDTGKLRIVFINYPLPFHTNALKAAEAIYCANDQEKLLEFRDIMFKNQNELSVEALKSYANKSRMDRGRFETCLDSGAYKDRVQNDLTKTQTAGINGAPGFIVARNSANGKIRGARISGAQPVENFSAAIDELLKKRFK